MSELLIQDSTLTNIADAIRTKTQTTGTYTPTQMPAAIMSISGGGGETFRITNGQLSTSPLSLLAAPNVGSIPAHSYVTKLTSGCLGSKTITLEHLPRYQCIFPIDNGRYLAFRGGGVYNSNDPTFTPSGWSQRYDLLNSSFEVIKTGFVGQIFAPQVNEVDHCWGVNQLDETHFLLSGNRGSVRPFTDLSLRILTVSGNNITATAPRYLGLEDPTRVKPCIPSVARIGTTNNYLYSIHLDGTTHWTNNFVTMLQFNNTFTDFTVYDNPFKTNMAGSLPIEKPCSPIIYHHKVNNVRGYFCLSNSIAPSAIDDAVWCDFIYADNNDLSWAPASYYIPHASLVGGARIHGSTNDYTLVIYYDNNNLYIKAINGTVRPYELTAETVLDDTIAPIVFTQSLALLKDTPDFKYAQVFQISDTQLFIIYNTNGGSDCTLFTMTDINNVNTQTFTTKSDFITNPNDYRVAADEETDNNYYIAYEYSKYTGYPFLLKTSQTTNNEVVLINNLWTPDQKRQLHYYIFDQLDPIRLDEYNKFNQENYGYTVDGVTDSLATQTLKTRVWEFE